MAGVGQTLSLSSIGLLFPGFNHLTVAGVGQTKKNGRIAQYVTTFQSPYGGIGASDLAWRTSCTGKFKFQSPCGGIGASDLQENLLNHLNILDSFNHLTVA